MPATALRLDHLVLTVADVDRACAFYTRILGMRRLGFGPDGSRVALAFGRQKINLHPHGGEFSPHARRPEPGSADLCFVIRGPLEAAMAHVRACGVAIEAGPVPRTGACGPLLSFYVRDPDGNLIECAVPAEEAGVIR